jgi:hypothetical protein
MDIQRVEQMVVGMAVQTVVKWGYMWVWQRASRLVYSLVGKKGESWVVELEARKVVKKVVRSDIRLV